MLNPILHYLQESSSWVKPYFTLSTGELIVLIASFIF